MAPPTAENDFLQFREDLKSYLYRLTANLPDAEDLLQDTYLKFAEKYGTFKGQASLKTWVFAIATNLAKDHKRVKNRWALGAQDQCKQAALTHQPYQNRIVEAFRLQPEPRFEIEEHIHYCFTCIAKNLALEQQIAIVLKEFYDFKRSEIADILQVTEGVVKHLLHNGRQALQQKYHHRCALINKQGVCHQCAELNDFLQTEKNAGEKIAKLDLQAGQPAKTNLAARFGIIRRINPLQAKGAKLEDTILQILREVIGDD
ncbi:MAG: RNA polymerase sigma factor [Bernardetiaceae bacterium]|jgi:RNA polymerase sigma-70 factor (ECF subfamily)|nr:RNA polymerase sigma factor [Bernardetiaceae bacterium]